MPPAIFAGLVSRSDLSQALSLVVTLLHGITTEILTKS